MCIVMQDYYILEIKFVIYRRQIMRQIDVKIMPSMIIIYGVV